MSDKTIDEEFSEALGDDITDMMIDSTEDLLEDARIGKTATSVEVMVAVLHQKGEPPALAYVAVEQGDDVGHDEVRDFCEEAQPHLFPGEKLSIETYNLAGLLAAYHAVVSEEEGEE